MNCNAIGCTRRTERFLCHKHWALVPQKLKNKLWRVIRLDESNRKRQITAVDAINTVAEIEGKLFHSLWMTVSLQRQEPKW